MATQNPVRYKSLLGWSSNAPAIPAGVPTTLNWVISERGISGRLVGGTGALGVISAFQHRNVNLCTGFAPLQLLDDTSEVNPRSRRFVEVNDPVSAVITSTAGAAQASLGWTTAPVRGMPSYYPGDAYRDGVRNLLWWGQTLDPTTVPPIGVGVQQQLQIDLAQGGQAGYICMGCASNPNLTDVFVVAIDYDNDNLIDGQFIPASMFLANNTDSPIFGAYLETNHSFLITIVNLSAAPLTDFAVCVTAG